MTIERDFTELAGKRVLIVEDELLLAKKNAEAVLRAGGIVLGPVADAEGAMAILEAQDIDAAILDVHLGGEIAFSVTASLRERGVPIIFIAGYDDWFLPDDFDDDVVLYREPANPDNVVRNRFYRTPRKPLSEDD